MNVLNARRTQLSIANRDLPFNITDWEHCIAGHAFRASRQVLKTDCQCFHCRGAVIAGSAAAWLELTPRQADLLFSPNGDTDREQAIARIEAMIELTSLVTAILQPSSPVQEDELCPV